MPSPILWIMCLWVIPFSGECYSNTFSSYPLSCVGRKTASSLHVFQWPWVQLHSGGGYGFLKKTQSTEQPLKTAPTCTPDINRSGPWLGAGVLRSWRQTGWPRCGSQHWQLQWELLEPFGILTHVALRRGQSKTCISGALRLSIRLETSLKKWSQKRDIEQRSWDWERK